MTPGWGRGEVREPQGTLGFPAGVSTGLVELFTKRRDRRPSGWLVRRETMSSEPDALVLESPVTCAS